MTSSGVHWYFYRPHSEGYGEIILLRVYVRPQGGEGVSCSLVPGLWSQVFSQGEGKRTGHTTDRRRRGQYASCGHAGEFSCCKNNDEISNSMLSNSNQHCTLLNISVCINSSQFFPASNSRMCPSNVNIRLLYMYVVLSSPMPSMNLKTKFNKHIFQRKKRAPSDRFKRNFYKVKTS